MKNLIITIACVVGLSIITNAQITQQYQEIPINSDHTQFKNPERGVNIFTVAITPNNWNCTPTAGTCGTSYVKLEDAYITSAELNQNTTVRRVFNLLAYNYNGSVIDQTYLSNMQSDFNFLRNNGLKATINFGYIGGNERYQSSGQNFTEDFPPNLQPQPNVQTVLNHIDQVGPILRQNSDVIFVFKAGFIGQYGEWFGLEGRSNGDDFGMPNIYDDPTLGLSAIQVQNRRSVVDKLLEYLPQNRMVELRVRLYKTIMYNLDFNNSNDQVNVSTAHNGSDLSRLGWHNDGWGAPNYYTFYQSPSVIQQIENFASNESNFVSGFLEYAEAEPGLFGCNFAINDMERFHISHMSPLQPKLVNTVTNTWTNEGCINEVYNRLGYRFKMIDASVNNGQVEQGGFIDLTINLDNVGFAAPINSRNVQLVFRHNGNGTEYKVNLCGQDPRFWFPNQTTTINETVGIPNNMPDGTYSLLLNLNDPEPTLYNDARYSIRLANQNVWESITGYNNLFMDVQVGNFNTASYNGNQILANANSVGANCGLTYSDGSITGSGSNGVTPPVVGGNCPTDLTLNASNNVTSGNNGDQSVQNQIEATNTIFANASATYTAGNRIILKPGFKALFGSYFNAFIEACTSPRLAKPNEQNVVKNNNGFKFDELLTNEDRFNEELLIYPNPLEDKATLLYYLKEADNVTVTLVDVTGKALATLAENQAQAAGQHQLELDARNLPTGIYYLKLQSNEMQVIKKLMIAK